jgi:hypothetical protein
MRTHFERERDSAHIVVGGGGGGVAGDQAKGGVVWRRLYLGIGWLGIGRCTFGLYYILEGMWETIRVGVTKGCDHAKASPAKPSGRPL